MPRDQTSSHPTSAGPRLRIWHLALLVLFVAIAIVNIQDQRRSEPVLIGVAIAGFAGYGVLGWLGWKVTRRLEGRLRPVLIFGLYLLAMGGLFLAATVAYLAIEHVYLFGRL
jgi:hypothetical protein